MLVHSCIKPLNVLQYLPGRDAHGLQRLAGVELTSLLRLNDMISDLPLDHAGTYSCSVEHPTPFMYNNTPTALPMP